MLFTLTCITILMIHLHYYAGVQYMVKNAYEHFAEGACPMCPMATALVCNPDLLAETHFT